MSEFDDYRLQHRILSGLQRDTVQDVVTDWCRKAFGVNHATNIEQRALRFLEEAIELYQACGGKPEMANELIKYIFERPKGVVKQELGGVGVTLLALAAAAGFSADGAEKEEVARVLSKPAEHWAARNKVKNDAGFNVVKPEYGDG